ncbi:MAG: hypothetical protein JSW71_01565 [Gemmatimonadota bacterium]|nr:MAG: hypothetical protein JSW71_01565 [Gemmatimonadota bacterium]
MDVDHALEAQLIHLERSNRLLLAVAIIMGVLLVAGFRRESQPVADLVQANRIRLVDVSGRVRLDPRHDTTATGMFILDESGGTRIGVAQSSHGGWFALHGPDMKDAVVLYLNAQDSLRFYDEAGGITTRRLLLQAREHGTGENPNCCVPL